MNMVTHVQTESILSSQGIAERTERFMSKDSANQPFPIDRGLSKDSLGTLQESTSKRVSPKHRGNSLEPIPDTQLDDL